MKSLLQHELHISPMGAQAMVWKCFEAMQPRARVVDGLSKRPETDANGDALPKMEMRGSVAVIPISGPLLHGATGSDKYWMGVSSYDDIAEDIEEGKKAGAKAFLFNMASPGGSVVGCPEAASMIADLSNETMVASFNGHMSCSAAEYLTAGCTLRFATPSSINGSIGTVMTVWSFEKMLERFGVSADIIASGKFKGAGHPAKSLTEEQRDLFKGFVNQSADQFKGWMMKHRPNIKPDSMQGQWFNGGDALGLGFVDALVPSIESALRLIS